MFTLRLYILISFAALILGACSGSARTEPEMIASFPVQDSYSPQPINPQPYLQYVYDASLEVDVSNLENAAQQAVDLAYQYRGYLVSSHTWQSGERQHARLVMAVPVDKFDAAYKALCRLGRVVDQHISGEWVSSGPGSGWDVYSEITLLLNDQLSSWPHLAGGWNPLRTLVAAWDIFVTIFGFLVDVVIWLVVVVGPFIAVAWVVRRIIKRLQPTQ